MRGKNSIVAGISALSACLLIGFSGCTAPRPEAPQPVGGVLDLRGRDLRAGGGVPLTGLWDFLPGSITISLDEFLRSRPTQRRVPDLWKSDEAGGRNGHGSGTYHLAILLPPDAPPLALHYLSASTAFRIEAQGRTLVQVGVPSEDRATAEAAYKPGFARLGEVGERVDLLIRVSNFAYRVGGLWYPIFLGSATSVESIHLGEVAAAIAQSTALTAMGLLLLLLFFLRRKDRAFLFCSLLSLVLALRVLVTGEYLITDIWPGIPFAIVIKLEYLTFCLAVPTATAFFTSLFPSMLGRRLKWACILPSLAYALAVVALPLDPMTRSLVYYQGFAILNIVVLGVAAFLKTVIKSDPEGIALFAGALILAASAINDVFYSSFVWWTGNLAPWGFLIFVVFSAVIMVRRMTKAFAVAEEMVAQKEFLIKEIHHRVKNSLQVVSSLLSLQSSRVADAETKDALAVLRMRIYSMSLVHEKLYGKAASDSLELGDYLKDLVGLLVSKDHLETARVRATVETTPTTIDADSCFDVGLIVTELVSNAMKHGLLPKGGGELRVTMSSEGQKVSILVEDDGPGLPPGFDSAKVTSLGYKLIASLLKTSGGSMEILPGPGGRVRIDLRAKLGRSSG